MNHALNPEFDRKLSLSLHRAYILVGIVGLVMVIFILNNYINATRLNRMTSPLWAAVREAKLEAVAVQHEAADLLRGEIDPSSDSLWLYLDQSIWYLTDLLHSQQQSHSSWLFSINLNISDRLAIVDKQIAQMKALLKDYKRRPRAPEAVGAAIMKFDEHFEALRFQLDAIEADISRIMVKEQLQQRISHAVLVVFCVVMIALVVYQIRRYERYRKENHATLNQANIQLAGQIQERERAEVALKERERELLRSEEKFRGLFESMRISYAFMKIANDNREIAPMLNQFVAAIHAHIGCGDCAIRLIDDDGTVHDTVLQDRITDRCELDRPFLDSNRGMCARVLNNDVDATLPWFTGYGSFLLDSGMGQAVETSARPATCEQGGCIRQGCRSLALVPIKAGDQIIGLIQIADAREGLISQSIVELMEAAAMQTGAAIRRIRAEAGLECAYLELEKRVLERTQALTDINRELQLEIEERGLVEQHLRKSRNTLQTVIDGISDSLILVDREMNVLMLNRLAAQNFHIDSLETALGKACFRAISGQTDECANCNIPSAVERGVNCTFERRGLLDPQRQERVTIYPVAEADDASGGAIIRIRDITEEKNFEQQLIQSEKMASLGILVSSIGHEINNPNNFITFNVPILREYLQALVDISDRYADTQPALELFHMSYDEFREDAFKLVDNIEHGASRISSFVSNLREFSQNNGSQEKLWLELPAVVDKVVSICRSQIKKRIRDFRIDIPVAQSRIYADEYSLEQVLLNLIVNAVQAADKPDSSIRLSAATGAIWQETTMITVADNGCGMDEKQLAKIFNPFYTTKSASEGTGLGLYVCHNLVQRLGGRIEVESKQGEGSRFTIILPDKDRRSKARG